MPSFCDKVLRCQKPTRRCKYAALRNRQQTAKGAISQALSMLSTLGNRQFCLRHPIEPGFHPALLPLYNDTRYRNLHEDYQLVKQKLCFD